MSNLGIHIYKEKKELENGIEEMKKKYNFSSYQIFLYGPKSYKKNKYNNDLIKDKIKKTKSNLYIHSSYMTNPWSLTKDEKKKEKMYNHTLKEIDSASDIEAKGLVLHIPKQTIEELIPIIIKLDKYKTENKKNVKILLEMKALKPDENRSYESYKQINKLIEKLIENGIKSSSVNICIDTAHIYAGKINIQSFTEMFEYLKKIKKKSYIGLIHLNGNMYNNKDKAKDKHCIPLSKEDEIWKDMLYVDTGCHAIINWCEEYKKDIILEIKNYNEEDLTNFLKKVY